MLYRMSSESSISVPRFSESFHAFAEFSEQITRRVALRFTFELSLHRFLLTSLRSNQKT